MHRADAAAAECREGLGDRGRPQPGHVAEEPEAVEEAAGSTDQGRSLEAMDRGEVLGEGAEVGVTTRVAGGLGALSGGRLGQLLGARWMRSKPDAPAAHRLYRQLSEELSIELASPLDFLPPLEGWLPRSRSVPPAGSGGVAGLTRRGSFSCSFPP